MNLDKSGVWFFSDGQSARDSAAFYDFDVEKLAPLVARIGPETSWCGAPDA